MAEPAIFQQPVALVDILDRVLGQGVVVSGEIVIGLAEIDLVRVSLRALLASIRPETLGSLDQGRPTDPRPTDPRPTDPRPTDPRPTDPGGSSAPDHGGPG